MGVAANVKRTSAQRTGIMLAAVGGLTISFDVPAIRLAGTDPYLTLCARGFALALIGFLVWLFAGRRRDMPTGLWRDRDFVNVGLIYGISNVCFTLAVFNTSTANLVFILAFNPMIAAILAWALIGERPAVVTWVALAITMAGVALIVGEGLNAGGGFGIAMSLACAATLALAITLTRKSGKNLSLSPALGGLMGGLLAIPFVYLYSSWPVMPQWLALDALLILPLASFTLALAPRYLPAPQSAMFYLIETALAPIWVWMIFTEVPSRGTVAGGALILVAILGHSWWQLRRRQTG